AAVVPGTRGTGGSPSPARANAPRTVFRRRRSGSRSARRNGRSHYPRAVRATLSHGTMSTVVHRRAAGSATGYSVYHRTVAGRAPTVPVARQAAASWVARFPRAGRRGHQRDPPPARRSAVGVVVAGPA